MKKFMAVLAMAAIVAFAAPALAATNPFMDVPQGHWSYDAVGLLASRGIVSGYPDGAFKGAQPATRYEMASIVARALVTVDAEKASAQDMELLKKLVMEFKDELDALGVKVDELDKRVAAIENNLGGWKISGQFWFDANFTGGDQAISNYSGTGHDNVFDKDRIRVTFTKQIDENTSFYAQIRGGSESSGSGPNGIGDVANFNLRNIYVDTKLPWDINFRVGRFFIDFEDDHGLYIDNDAIFGDFRVDGFQFTKTWNNFYARAVVGRNYDSSGAWTTSEDDGSNYVTDAMVYGLDLTWQPNEAFFIGVNGVWFVEDANDDAGFEYESGVQGDTSTYSVYASYSFTPAITLQGTYYYQDLDGAYHADDDADAWRITLDLGQDLLKFTGLRFEYQQLDNNFEGPNDPYSFGNSSANAASVMDQFADADENGTTKLFFVYAEQKWNDKWSSYLRYTFADFDTDWLDDAQSYGIGVTYQYTPAIAFRLAYDLVDYGDNAPSYYDGKDHVFQFRTAINF